jgi:hypothetical protein
MMSNGLVSLLPFHFWAGVMIKIEDCQGDALPPIARS